MTLPLSSLTSSPGLTKSLRSALALLTIALTMYSVSSSRSGSPTTGPNAAVLMLMPSTVRATTVSCVTRAIVPLLANVLLPPAALRMTVISCGVRLMNNLGTKCQKGIDLLEKAGRLLTVEGHIPPKHKKQKTNEHCYCYLHR